MNKAILLVGLLLVIGLLLAACSGGTAPSANPAPGQGAGQDDGNNLGSIAANGSQGDQDAEEPSVEIAFEPTPSPLIEQSYNDNPISARDYSEYEIVTLLPQDGIPALTNPPMYAAALADDEYRPDEMIIGVEYNGDARAYPVDLLSRHEIVNDTIGGIHAAVTW